MPSKSLNRKINQAKTKSNISSPIKNKFRSVIFSPVFNVAALVLLLLGVFGGLRLVSSRQTPGQVTFIEQSNFETDDLANEKAHIYAAPEIFKGEVYDTSIRLREIGALGMAISLAVFAINHEQGNVPPDLERIWGFISERKLMPPGLQFESRELISPSGAISVRYQSKPLRFEILSRPKPNAKSPAILLRFPLASLDGRTITYFQSTSINAQATPAPFAPLEQIVSAGWTLEQWRGELFPQQGNWAQILDEEKRLLTHAPVNH